MEESVDTGVIGRPFNGDAGEWVTRACDRHFSVFLPKFQPSVLPKAARALLRLFMELARPHKDCRVVHEGRYVLAIVGPGTSDDVFECYRTLVFLAIQHKYERALVVGEADDDPMHHLAARDGIVALHQIGVPAGFRIAFVPKTTPTLNGYRHAEIEARQRGIRARVLLDQDEAIRWLMEEDHH